MDATELATFWVFIALLTFLGILVYMGVPKRLLAALDMRAEKIRSDLDQASRLRSEAQTLLAEYQRRRTEAEEEARGIIEQARREAETLAVEARDRMADYVERRTRAVETRIAQAETQALAEVKARAVDVATLASARILAERADGAAGDRLVDQSIAAVRARLN